jgi:hypothetical protein
MNADTAVIAGLLGLTFVVTAIVLLATNARDRLMPEETGAATIYSETCGARLGARNWSKPFVQLRVHRDFLVLGCVQPLLLPYSSVTGVRRISTLLGRGIVVEHNLPSAPLPVVIWTNNETKIIALLQCRITPVISGYLSNDI